MTSENEMPEVIWAYNDGLDVCLTICEPTEHDVFPHAKYTRASRPDVNEQMLEALKGYHRAAQKQGWSSSYENEFNQAQQAIAAAEAAKGER